MSRELFDSVIQGLCGMYKLDPAHVAAGGAVEMGGVNFCLLHDREGDSPLLMVYCDFGAVPQELQAQVYKKLLESNLSTYTGQGETFCLAPDGRVVLANNYPLEFLTPELLAGHLALMSIFAKNWRDGYLLDDDQDKTVKKNARGEYFAKKMARVPK